MKTGIVSKWNPKMGYGFISPESGGHDLFVHRSAIQCHNGRNSDLPVGARVAYEVAPDERRPGRMRVSKVFGEPDFSAAREALSK